MKYREVPLPPPTLIVDTREQRPLEFRRCPSRVATLRTGDYSVAGYEESFAVERKSIDDLVGSVTAGRDRFFREMARMENVAFRRVIVCGPRSSVLMKRYHAQHVSPRAVLAAVSVIEVRYGVPVVWATCPREAAAIVEEWAYYFTRERRMYGPGGKPRAAAQGTFRAAARATRRGEAAET